MIVISISGWADRFVSFEDAVRFLKLFPNGMASWIVTREEIELLRDAYNLDTFFWSLHGLTHPMTWEEILDEWSEELDYFQRLGGIIVEDL